MINAYMFICNKPRDKLPQQVINYIKWGEPICPYCGARFINNQVDEQGYFTCTNGHKVPGNLKCTTRIRRTRGGGRAGGRIASEAEACKARQSEANRSPGKPFYGWYDLGGYIPTPVMAIYQARYHPQFFLCEIPIVTYHAIIAFIPKVKLNTNFMKYNPEDYKQYLPEIKPSITLDEVEVKALLAYLNSTFNWLWIEQNARYIAKGPLGLEVSIAKAMPIINVKVVSRDDVKELAKLFDELEENARKTITSIPKTRRTRGDEEEIGGTKLEMIMQLRPIFKKIDEKIAKILGIDIDVDLLWGFAWSMMERRVKGAREVARPGASEEGIKVIKGKRKSSRDAGFYKTLDEFF